MQAASPACRLVLEGDLGFPVVDPFKKCTTVLLSRFSNLPISVWPRPSAVQRVMLLFSVSTKWWKPLPDWTGIADRQGPWPKQIVMEEKKAPATHGIGQRMRAAASHAAKRLLAPRNATKSGQAEPPRGRVQVHGLSPCTPCTILEPR